MRILWISHFLLYPETGYGALQRSRNLLIELCKRHEVTYLSYYRDFDLSQGYSLKEAKENLESICEKVILLPHKHNGNQVLKLWTQISSLFNIKPYSTLLYNSPVLIKKMQDLLIEEDIDLIYSDTMGMSEKILDKCNIPTVLNHHNIESQMMFRRGEKASNLFMQFFLKLETLKLRHYEKKYCKQYNMNLTVSELDKQRLEDICDGASAVVIENGVDTGFFKFSNHRDHTNKELIFTGGMSWYPNQDAMIFFTTKVWPLLKQNIPDIKLTIVGRNPGKELSDIVSKDEKITLTGFVPDVRDYVKKASIFIVPIRDGGGTKLKILDAMSQGIPIVSSALGFEGIDAIDGQHLFMANEPQEYVDKIKFILDTPEKSQAVAKNAYRLIEQKYAYKVIGSKFNRVMEQLNT